MNGQEEKLDQVAIISTKTDRQAFISTKTDGQAFISTKTDRQAFISTKTDRHSFLVKCKMPLATGGKGRTIKDAKTKDKRRNVYA